MKCVKPTAVFGFGINPQPILFRSRLHTLKMALGNLGISVRRPRIKTVKTPSKLQLCMLLLLLCGDIESNPGPASRSSRQTTLSQSQQGDLSVELSLKDILFEIKESRTEVTDKIDSLTTTMNAKFEEIAEENKNLREELETTKQKNEEIMNKLADLEDRSRRNNLVISGVDESYRETWEQTEAKLVNDIKNKLGVHLQDLDIERAHRIGKAMSGKQRPIVARFTNFKTKEKVITAARRKKITGFYVNEDYSEETRQVRRNLTELMKNKKSQGMTAFLRYRKLVVRNTDGKENWYEEKKGNIIRTKYKFNEPGISDKEEL